MQLKTISKNIKNKMNEWLASISNDQLRMDVKKNLLVSGGSITSMLLGLPINDYDVYIKDMNVLLRLMEYYAIPNHVTVLDGRRKSEYSEGLETAYAGFLEQFGKEEAGIDDLNNMYSIAVRNLHKDQIKLFHRSGGLKVNQDATEEEKLKYIPLFFSPNAVSLSNDVQIVCRFHGDDVAIHKTFDFIHATNYFTFENGLVTNKEAIESILTKQLKYQGSLYPLTSIIRMKKFIKRDWNINAGEILKILFQVSLLDLKNPDVLEEQLIGVDVAYFETLIKILRGVKENTLTSEYLNTIIDRVFNQDDSEE